jgi:hypothetical protein
MRQSPSLDALTLEASANSARLALACAYSSSDEYEAEVIQTRRRAGAYRPRHQRRTIAALAIGTILVAVAALVLPF